MSKFYATYHSYAELRISRTALLPLPWNGNSYIWRTRKHEKNIPRRVAKFRENRPRDVENLVDGKKNKK